MENQYLTRRNENILREIDELKAMRSADSQSYSEDYFITKKKCQDLSLEIQKVKTENLRIPDLEVKN